MRHRATARSSTLFGLGFGLGYRRGRKRDASRGDRAQRPWPVRLGAVKALETELRGGIKGGTLQAAGPGFLRQYPCVRPCDAPHRARSRSRARSQGAGDARSSLGHGVGYGPESGLGSGIIQRVGSSRVRSCCRRGIRSFPRQIRSPCLLESFPRLGTSPLHLPPGPPASVGSRRLRLPSRTRHQPSRRFPPTRHGPNPESGPPYTADTPTHTHTHTHTHTGI